MGVIIYVCIAALSLLSIRFWSKSRRNAEKGAIPGPAPLPFLGNVLDIDVKNSIRSMIELSDTYGPIYRLMLGTSSNVVVVANYEVINQVMSNKDFIKFPAGVVVKIREVVHDALITAYHYEENWAIAHRTLTPAFSPPAVKNMFNDMHDVCSQLLAKWERLGPDVPIDVTTDLQSMALDTLALCAMDTRLNSLDRPDSEPQHPVVKALNDIMTEVTLRSGRPVWYSSLQRSANRKFDENNAFVHHFARDVISNRRANPAAAKNDLLDAMVNGRDPVTGKPLTDDSIENNMITFLIAGSETTANLLAFTLYYLLANPESLSTLRREIDTVLGNRTTIEPSHLLKKLTYTRACLRESLRLQPTAPAIAVKPFHAAEPVTVTSAGTQYLIKPDQSVLILLHKLHRDPAVWGPDAEQFRPERMLLHSEEHDGKSNKLPKNAYRPFGNGKRACIGSEFAFQEGTIALARIVQRFEFGFFAGGRGGGGDDDVSPKYELKVRQAVSIKPEGMRLWMRVR